MLDIAFNFLHLTMPFLSFLAGAVAGAIASSSKSTDTRTQYCSNCSIPRTRDHPCHNCYHKHPFTYTPKSPGSRAIPYTGDCPNCMREANPR